MPLPSGRGGGTRPSGDGMAVEGPGGVGYKKGR